MKSALPKVMHRAAGRTLLGHVLASAAGLSPKRAVVVVGPDMDAVGLEAQRYFPGCNVAIQAERQGTAHAVSMAKEGLKGFTGTILVLYADVPLVQSASLSALAGTLDKKTPLAVLGFDAADPHGYGRLLKAKNGSIRAIREELDASAQEKKIRLCNAGIISINSNFLWKLIPQIKNKNAKREYYLTDLIGLMTGFNWGPLRPSFRRSFGAMRCSAGPLSWRRIRFIFQRIPRLAWTWLLNPMCFLGLELRLAITCIFLPIRTSRAQASVRVPGLGLLPA
jgi:bifunctional N-acetylglucosamine-1-phosphate-uridyltransferase/glucosamine-1-phosphate-acetyltransferase GlmU-like protein